METNTTPAPAQPNFGVLLLKVALVNAAVVAGCVGGAVGSIALVEKLSGRKVVKDAESITKTDAN